MSESKITEVQPEEAKQYRLIFDPLTVTLPQLAVVLLFMGVVVNEAVFKGLPGNIKGLYQEI